MKWGTAAALLQLMFQVSSISLLFILIFKESFFPPYSLPQKKPQHLSSCSSALSYLDRLVPPSFSRKLKETNGVLGSSVLLECKVSGTAPISVSWFQDGNEIVSGEKYEISFLDNVCALKLNALDVTDTGSYTCVAANVAGSDECSAFLTVQGQWKDTAMPSKKFFFPLLFYFSGFPMVSFSWFVWFGVFSRVFFYFFFLIQTCSFHPLHRDPSINIFLPLSLLCMIIRTTFFCEDT